MAKPLGLPPPLPPGIHWTDTPLFAGAKDRSLSNRAALFPNCTATENGSHCNGAHLAARAKEKKPVPCATHTAAGKAARRLNRHTVQRSVEHERAAVQRLTGATVQR